MFSIYSICDVCVFVMHSETLHISVNLLQRNWYIYVYSIYIQLRLRRSFHKCVQQISSEKWTIAAVSSEFIFPYMTRKENSGFSSTLRVSSVPQTLSLLFLLNSLLICQALFSSWPSSQVKFYIHHKSDAAVAIFTLSPIIIVYRQ